MISLQLGFYQSTFYNVSLYCSSLNIKFYQSVPNFTPSVFRVIVLELMDNFYLASQLPSFSANICSHPGVDFIAR